MLTCACCWPIDWLAERVAAGRLTMICPLPLDICPLTSSWLSGVGNVQVTRLAHQRAASFHDSQLAVHRPSASLVQAATRPRPYCQTASTGSSRWLISTSCAVGLGVVAT